MVGIGISLDGLFCDCSTTESPAGAAKGEATPVTNNQPAKDDVETEFKTTGGDTFKNVLYKIVKIYSTTNLGLMESDTATVIIEDEIKDLEHITEASNPLPANPPKPETTETSTPQVVTTKKEREILKKYILKKF